MNPTNILPSQRNDAFHQIDAMQDAENGASAPVAPPRQPPNAPASGASDPFVMLPTAAIDRNHYNPNRMAADDFGTLVAKTKQMRRNPMPIKVRPNGARFTIINGTHNFQAALEAGLAEVLCEIEDVDEFEAMRQTLDYNRHGEHDRLREGLMFHDMLRQRQLSQRQLAKEIDISEGKVRTGLAYVQAAALRLGCTADEVRTAYAENENEMTRIASLSNDQVRTYVQMPDCFRDKWLDAGARMEPLRQTFVFEAYGDVSTGAQLVARLTDSGLLHHVDPGIFFARSLMGVAEFDFWCGEHLRVQHVRDYVEPVIENGLPLKVLEHLPLEPAGAGNVKVILPLAVWTEIIARCCAATKNGSSRVGMIAAGVHQALVDAGRNPAESLSRRDLKMLDAVMEDAPPFIMEAAFLSVEERYRLHRAVRYVDEELLLEAKRHTVEQFRRWRTEGEGADAEEQQRSVIQVFDEQLERLQRDRCMREEGALFDHPEKLVDKIIESIRYTAGVADVEIDGRQALELMREDLETLPPPALALMAACVLPSRRPAAIMHWLKAKRS